MGSKESIATSYSTQNKCKNVDSVKAIGRLSTCREVLSLKKMKLCTEYYTEVASSHTDLKRVHKTSILRVVTPIVQYVEVKNINIFNWSILSNLCMLL